MDSIESTCASSIKEQICICETTNDNFGSDLIADLLSAIHNYYDVAIAISAAVVAARSRPARALSLQATRKAAATGREMLPTKYCQEEAATG